MKLESFVLILILIVIHCWAGNQINEIYFGDESESHNSQFIELVSTSSEFHNNWHYYLLGLFDCHNGSLQMLIELGDFRQAYRTQIQRSCRNNPASASVYCTEEIPFGYDNYPFYMIATSPQVDNVTAHIVYPGRSLYDQVASVDKIRFGTSAKTLLPVEEKRSYALFLLYLPKNEDRKSVVKKLRPRSLDREVTMNEPWHKDVLQTATDAMVYGNAKKCNFFEDTPLLREIPVNRTSVPLSEKAKGLSINRCSNDEVSFVNAKFAQPSPYLDNDCSASQLATDSSDQNITALLMSCFPFKRAKRMVEDEDQPAMDTTGPSDEVVCDFDQLIELLFGPKPEFVPHDAECFIANSDAHPDLTKCGEKGADGGALTRLADLLTPKCRDKQFAASELDYAKGARNVADLILARATGMFLEWDFSTLQKSNDVKDVIQDKYVCKKHAQDYGYKWWERIGRNKMRMQIQGKRSEKCGIRSFDGNPNIHTTNVRGNYGILSRIQSLSLYETHNTLHDIGTPMCRNHFNWIEKLKDNYMKEKKGYQIRGKPVVDSSQCFLNSLIDLETCALISHTPEGPSACPDDVDKRLDLKYVASLRELVNEFGKKIGISGIHFSHPHTVWQDIGQRMRYKKILAAQKLTHAIYEAFNPTCPATFEANVLQKSSGLFWNMELPSNLQNILDQVEEAFQISTKWSHKKMILSIVAPTMTIKQLSDRIPGLSIYMYKAARMWNLQYGSGGEGPIKTKPLRVRFEEGKIETFIDFLMDDITDLPFGTLKVKKSSGEKLTIPATVRSMHNERLVDQYLKFLKQTGQYDKLRMSRSSLLKIAKWAKSRTSLALAGLDYYAVVGHHAFVTLIEIVDKMEKMSAVTEEWARDAKKTLLESKAYLKMEYKLHLKPNSHVDDHCYYYALSDPTNELFQKDCEDHQHDRHSVSCDSCRRLARIYSEIAKPLHNTEFSNALEKREAIWLVQEAEKNIKRLKAHVLRSTYLEQIKTDVLDNLPIDTLFITADFAMKWIPRSRRESQSDWFGKRGISWHILVLYHKQLDGTLLTRTLVHIQDQGSQDSADVTAILGHSLATIRNELNGIVNKVIIRSDNAACYKSSATIASMHEISQETGVTISRWMFSEAQTGKGPADRAAARIKARVNAFLDENKGDVTTAEEFLQAASSYDGLRDVSIFVGRVQKQPQDKKSRAAIPQITKYHDISFTNDPTPKLKVHRMPGIGDGLVLNERYWLNRGNKAAFVVDKEVHESDHAKVPGYNYWKPISGKLGTKFTCQVEQDEKSRKAFLREMEDNARKCERDMKEKLKECEEDPECKQWAEHELEACHKDNDAQRSDCLQHMEQADDGVGDDETVLAEELANKGTTATTDDGDIENDHILFDCPDPLCIKQFQFEGNLALHVIRNHHTYRPTRESMQDVALNMFMQKLESVKQTRVVQVHDSIQIVQDRNSHCSGDPTGLSKGWALLEAPQNWRFTINQKEYLDQKFNEGQASGKKFDPTTVAKGIRYETDINGNPRFGTSEFLTDVQIASYFSRVSQQRKKAGVGEIPQGDQPKPAHRIRHRGRIVQIVHTTDSLGNGNEEKEQKENIDYNPKLLFLHRYKRGKELDSDEQEVVTEMDDDGINFIVSMTVVIDKLPDSEFLAMDDLAIDTESDTFHTAEMPPPDTSIHIYVSRIDYIDDENLPTLEQVAVENVQLGITEQDKQGTIDDDDDDS